MGKAGLDLCGIVAHDEAIPKQPFLDGLNGANDARVVGGKEAGGRNQEQATV